MNTVHSCLTVASMNAAHHVRYKMYLLHIHHTTVTTTHSTVLTKICVKKLWTIVLKFLFNQLTALIITYGWGRVWKGLCRQTLVDCWNVICYKPDAVANAKPRVSKHWRCVIVLIVIMQNYDRIMYSIKFVIRLALLSCEFLIRLYNKTKQQIVICSNNIVATMDG